jgi:hypothetical protein
MSYIVAHVKTDGCIRLQGRDDWASVVHRETRFPSPKGEVLYERLADAKAQRRDDEIIVEIDSQGAASAVWVKDEHRVVTCARLDRWKGCYGRMAVKKLNQEA